MLDVDATSTCDVWWRHIPARGDLYHRPETPADGRWQRGTVVDAYYFAAEPATAWAEWYRSVAELGVPPGMG